MAQWVQTAHPPLPKSKLKSSNKKSKIKVSWSPAGICSHSLPRDEHCQSPAPQQKAPLGALNLLSRDAGRALLLSTNQGLTSSVEKGGVMIYLDGFQQMDHIGDEEAPARSIFTFSSPFLFRMLMTPLDIPKARYWPSFVQLIKHTRTENGSNQAAGRQNGAA